MERNTEFLKKLVSSYGCAGYEDDVCDVFVNECNNYGVVTKDNIKNVKIQRGNGKTKVMISAHSDWIAFVVTGITEHGFLHIKNIGGSDRRTIFGANIVVKTEQNNYINGIVGINPIHVVEYDDWSKINKYEDILVDVGCTTKNDVETLGIEIGNPIFFKTGNEFIEFGPSKKQIVGTALDDRIGLYITAEVMKRINNDNITLYGVANSQEEVGLRGATISAATINPDISIDIDVCPSTESETNINKSKFSDVELGKGCVISYGPDKNININKELKRIAKEKNILYQIEVDRVGGTNTDAIQLNSANCATALISIPNRNMHTQVEMCNWDDVNGAIEILVEYINNIK